MVMLSLASSFPGAVGVCEKLFHAKEKKHVKNCINLKGPQGNFKMRASKLPALSPPISTDPGFSLVIVFQSWETASAHGGAG